MYGIVLVNPGKVMKTTLCQTRSENLQRIANSVFAKHYTPVCRYKIFSHFFMFGIFSLQFFILPAVRHKGVIEKREMTVPWVCWSWISIRTLQPWRISSHISHFLAFFLYIYEWHTYFALIIFLFYFCIHLSMVEKSSRRMGVRYGTCMGGMLAACQNLVYQKATLKVMIMTFWFI